MIKRIFLVIVAIFSSIFETKSKTNHEQIIINNPYTNAAKAGMIPKTEMKKKIKLLQRVAKKVTSLSPYLPLIESYYISNDLNKILTLLKNKKKLEKLIIENGKTGLTVVKTYIKLKQNNKAKELLIKLNEKHIDNQEIAFLTAQFYENSAIIYEKQKQPNLSKQELNKAITTVNKYLNNAPKRFSNFAFLFLRSRLHLKLEEKEKALKDIEEAIEIQPQFEMGWFLFAQLKEKKGNINDAINGYSNYLDLVSSKPQNISGKILFKAIESKLLKLMFMQIIKKHPTFDHKKIEEYKQKIMKLFNKNKYKEAIKELNSLLPGEKLKDEKRLVKIQILGNLKQYKEAGKLVKKWILEDPNNSLWFEALYLLNKAGLNSKHVINILKKIDEKHPNLILPSLYLADIFAKTKNEKEAIKYNKKAASLTNDTELKISINFQLSILFYKQKEYEQAEKILEKIIIIKPNNKTILKHLAKIYKKRGKKNKSITYPKAVTKLT